MDKNPWNRATHRITSLDFINEHDNTMLLVGSEDGAVRVWSNYANNVPNRDPSLVTAWSALAEINGLSRNSYSAGELAIEKLLDSEKLIVLVTVLCFICLVGVSVGGLRLAWNQRSQTLFAAGDARIIRLWDIEAELKLSDISTGSDSFVNAIGVDNDGKVMWDIFVRLANFNRYFTNRRVKTERKHHIFEVLQKNNTKNGGIAYERQMGFQNYNLYCFHRRFHAIFTNSCVQLDLSDYKDERLFFRKFIFGTQVLIHLYYLDQNSTRFKFFFLSGVLRVFSFSKMLRPQNFEGV